MPYRYMKLVPFWTYVSVDKNYESKTKGVLIDFLWGAYWFLSRLRRKLNNHVHRLELFTLPLSLSSSIISFLFSFILSDYVTLYLSLQIIFTSHLPPKQYMYLNCIHGFPSRRYNDHRHYQFILFRLILRAVVQNIASYKIRWQCRSCQEQSEYLDRQNWHAATEEVLAGMGTKTV